MTDVLLRDRMAREIDAHEPMPDLVSGTIRRGRSTRRRRRLAVGALVGAGAMGATAVAVGVAPGMFERSSRPSGATEGNTEVHRVSDAGYREAIRSTFADLLPERYGDVVVREGADAEGGDRFWTTGDVGVSFTFDVDGMPDDPAVAELVDCTILGLGPTDCREARFDGWLAVATIRNLKGTHDAQLTLNDWGLTARMVVAAGSPDVLPTLDEQQAILTAPAFVDLVRLGVDYGSDRASGAHFCTEDGDCGPMPLPVWRH